MSVATDKPPWEPCQLEEHLVELRSRRNDLESAIAQQAGAALMEPLLLFLATASDLLDHVDGLHDDDCLVRLVQSGEL